MKLPWHLVLRNLLKHPLRSSLTAGSLAVALFLLCTLRGLVDTLDAGVKASRSERVIVQSAVSLFVYLPESYEQKIRGVEGVKDVCRWNWFGGYYSEPRNFFAQFASDARSLLSMYPEIAIVDGSGDAFVANRQGCLIGAGLAADYGWKVGQTVPIISALFPRVDGKAWEFVVEGIYRSTSSAVDNRTLFFHYDYLQKSLEEGAATGPSSVGIYVVQLADPGDAVDTMRRIDQLFENGPQRVQSTSESEFQAQFVSMIGNIPFFVSAIGLGVFTAIVLAVLNTMLMAAREQTRDTGILKALGFTNRMVFFYVVAQSIILCLAGGGLGLAAAAAAAPAITDALGVIFPNFEISGETVALGAGAALLVGLIAGLVPAAVLSRLSCVESFRLET